MKYYNKLVEFCNSLTAKKNNNAVVDYNDCDINIKGHDYNIIKRVIDDNYVNNIINHVIDKVVNHVNNKNDLINEIEKITNPKINNNKNKIDICL